MPEEILTHVPLHALFNAGRQSGRRSAKRKLFSETFAHTGGLQIWDERSRRWIPRADSRLPAHYRGQVDTNISRWHSEEKLVVPAGNLENSEYRFWIGMREQTSSYSKCRMCDAPANSKKVRLMHQRGGHCTTNLVKIFSLLNEEQPRVCSVCKTPTQKSHWGLPLCDEYNCLVDWKFGFFFGSLNRAKNFARLRGLLQEDKL